MVRFDLDQIEDYKDATPAIEIALPVGGAYLLQCALSTMDKRWQWMDDGDNLTDEQWDELQAEIAALMLALITEVDSMGVPIGMILPYASTLVPDGFLWCNGDEYERVAYPLLYAVLPPMWIVDEDNFEVPNLTNKFMRGCGDPFCYVGLEAGDDEHTLTINEMPSHNHTLRWVLVGGPGSTRVTLSAGGEDKETIIVGDRGGGNSHNNIPAYMSLPYYIRAE